MLVSHGVAMKRRSKAGREPIKGQRRKTAEPRSRNAPKAVARSKSSVGREDTEVVRLSRELNEAREQQTATGDVLKVISRSSFDLQAVLDTLVKLAARLCEADLVAIHRPRGGVMQFAANFGLSQEWEEIVKRTPIVPGRGTATGRVLLTGKTVQIADVDADPEYTFTEGQKAGGFHTVLAVPLDREGETIGVIVLCRTKVRPFTDKQIELVQNFAAQAVIAIENARLLNELRQSLEQQTATSQVLQVISSSPGNLKQVFAAILENATRICEAKFGALYLSEGDGFRAIAMHNAPPAYEEARAGVLHPPPSTSLWRAANTKQAVQIADVTLERGYIEGDPFNVSAVTLGGYRSVFSVPMLHEDKLIGVITIFRQEVRPFTEEQISLVQNFAAQAVIAIENARLLNELRQRTDDLSQRTTDLTEALEQQTATSDVLKIISSSSGELRAVFDAMLENATRLCAASYGTMWLRERDGRMRIAALHGLLPDAFRQQWHVGTLFRPNLSLPTARAFETRKPVQVVDLKEDHSYFDRDPLAVASVDAAGIRSLISVPMLKDAAIVGTINIYRREVRPFADKQIELVTNFAAQAVIAIENARLLNELRDLNQQLEQRVADQVGEIERMGRLRRFLPPQVADLIVASGTEKQLESHRREITALFCDLRGFTGFTESADAEDVIALLREYHAAVGEKIIKYSGTLERYAGDGVMVVFNDPVPVENPALQAVLMALEMRDAIGALTETWHRWGHDIGFGIGIAHGFATLGTIGFEGRFDYAAIGTVSNVASRLCDEAKPGQILISPRVLTKVENAVKVEPVGEFELKGIRRPLAAYNVIAAVS